VAASALKQGGLFAPISREGALVLNNPVPHHRLRDVFIVTLCTRWRWQGTSRPARQDFGRRAVLQSPPSRRCSSVDDRSAVSGHCWRGKRGDLLARRSG